MPLKMRAATLKMTLSGSSVLIKMFPDPLIESHGTEHTTGLRLINQAIPFVHDNGMREGLAVGIQFENPVD
jgi:hypothetical protein